MRQPLHRILNSERTLMVEENRLAKGLRKLVTLRKFEEIYILIID